MNKLVTVTLVLGLISAGSVGAAELAKEGTYDHDECWVGSGGTITHSDKVMAGSFTAHGIAPSVKPGSLYHNVTGVCVGSWIYIDGEYSESSACEYTDPSGDKFFGVASRKNDQEGDFKVLGGTGKYSGMTNMSKWKPITDSPQPDGYSVVCLRDRGAWKLR